MEEHNTKGLGNNDEEIEVRYSNFIQDIINDDMQTQKYGGSVHTRFPPEPNGYLHIGHAKSICLNFGIAAQNKGLCNLRFDDTNPTKEEDEYVESIKTDVKWLGFDWEDRLYYASDYFEYLYQCAVKLIEMGKAYVCELSADQIREYRGTLKEPGKESPYRNRTVEENLDLFKRMRDGEFEDGSKVLRAKIDMTSPNLNMRDPVIYRIMRATHHKTGDKWCIYPMYDYAHPLSDSKEGITHSICTLEFEDHRPLYNWVLETLDVECKSSQIEFARLNLSYTVMSKRKLLQLVKEGHVRDWDDPRMPTVSGLRRRGYTPESIRDFCARIGVAKSNSVVDLALLEHCIREELNLKATRVMAVLRPLKVVIDNYEDGLVEEFEVPNNPEDPEAGTRKVPFSKVIYIEQDDFCENPPKKYFRLAPGQEVRLKSAYIVKCENVVKDEKTGEILEVHCSYDPGSRGGSAPDGRKVKGTIHWVSADHAIDAEVRLYDNLFNDPNPGTDENIDFLDQINPNSLEVLQNCKMEPDLKNAKVGDKFQFLRLGYFCVDSEDSKPGAPIFNRTVSLKDSWAKISNK
jgi:glutaminyl-tRNA synthetase